MLGKHLLCKRSLPDIKTSLMTSPILSADRIGKFISHFFLSKRARNAMTINIFSIFYFLLIYLQISHNPLQYFQQLLLALHDIVRLMPDN